MIVLDTNVISEVMRPEPAASVLAWLAAQPVRALFTTAVTRSEILYGIALLPQGKRRAAFLSAANAIFDKDFAGRILPFDNLASPVFADICAHRDATGQPISQFDGLIAAIAHSRGAHIATRNTKDFSNCGLELINPWEANA